MNANRKGYKVKIEQFLDITSPEVAYFLGYFWADGCVVNDNRKSRLRMNITENDGNSVKDVFSKLGEWNIYIRKKQMETWQNIMSFNTMNKYLYNFLMENDYHIKSGASANKIISNIPHNLLRYWWRGYLDGDGSINTRSNTLEFHSCYSQNWDFSQKLFEDIGVKYSIYNRIRKNGNKSSSIRVAGRYNILKVLDYIYQDYNLDKIGLSRKYDKYYSIDKVIKIKRKTSKYKYVFLKKSNKWGARITKNKKIGLNKIKILGTFDTEELAHEEVVKYLSIKTPN